MDGDGVSAGALPATNSPRHYRYGHAAVLHQHDRAHAIVLRKPSQQVAFGGPRVFGHDGAAGALACVDPDSGLAFAWTVVRGPWPGGADPRPVALARELGALLDV